MYLSISSPRQRLCTEYPDFMSKLNSFLSAKYNNTQLYARNWFCDGGKFSVKKLSKRKLKKLRDRGGGNRGGGNRGGGNRGGGNRGGIWRMEGNTGK